MSADSRAPSYISSHSADVILSDIRPIKLKKDALNALNVLVDEILFNILNASRSLQTDRLRAGLLHVLPTSLGKEALLEAEVELRAYWDRTNPKGNEITPEDDSKTFNLLWSYELLRLKCEAYSTLNESDEDPDTETRLQNRMLAEGAVSSPRQSLIAPAALYLTAILESICEHILSDVARVAARDSSRTGATGQDLFTALCEDDAIYGLFKAMKVYEQIELLAQGPRPRRSKSISRSDKLSMSRTSSQEHNSGRDTPGAPPSHRSRMSTDTTTAAGTSSQNSRSSFEKARGMKKLIGRSSTSNDRDGEHAYHLRRSESILSDETRGWDDHVDDDDAALEFDSLMKSGETMKVSLTPDRLRSMEARKQKEDSSSSQPPRPQTLNRRPSPRQVHSITEDDEGPVTPPRPSTATNGNSQSPITSPSPKARTSSSTPRSSLNKRPSNGNMSASRGMPKTFDADPFPQKTRRIQRKRESMDLDDIMNGSDDEAVEETSPKAQNGTAPSTPKKPGNYAVSARTRELMDFLDQGPPNVPNQNQPGAPHISKASRELVDFLNQGPPTEPGPPPHAMSPDAKKGSGRLQRMMSKLSMNGNERPRVDELSRSVGPGSRTPTTPTLQTRTSAGNLASLANRPVPPRYPRPISPPSSPSEEQHNVPRPRAMSAANKPPPSSWEAKRDADAPAPPVKGSAENGAHPRNASLSAASAASPNGRANGVVKAVPARVPPPQVASPPLSPDRTTVDPPKRHTPKAGLTAIQTSPSVKATEVIPVQQPLAAGSFTQDDAKDVRRLFARATNADECRVLLELFLAKSGRPIEPDLDNPYPSPSPSENATTIRTPLAPAQGMNVDPGLEPSLVDLFLGGEKISEAPATPRKRKTKRKVSKVEPEQAVVPAPVPEATSPSALSANSRQLPSVPSSVPGGSRASPSPHAAREAPKAVAQVGA